MKYKTKAHKILFVPEGDWDVLCLGATFALHEIPYNAKFVSFEMKSIESVGVDIKNLWKALCDSERRIRQLSKLGAKDE